VVLVRFALRNPYGVMAVALGLIMLGLAAFPRIPSDILPDFNRPVVVSFFSYPGLPTIQMENSVTSRIERVLTLAGGLERIESRTMPGASIIKVFFRPGTDPSSAMNDIVNQEANDIHHLPPGIEYPFTLRSDPANLPVILAAISGEGLSESELYTIGYYAVRNKMGGLEGVQIPHPFGGKFRQMMIYVDPQKLEAYQLSPVDVVDALENANLVLAGGTLKVGTTDYQVHPVNTLPTPADIDNVPVAIRDGRPIFIKDIGHASDDAAIQYNIVRVNGVRSVYAPMMREPGQNTIAVVDRIREGLAREIPNMKLRGEIPEATQIDLVSDQSSYIRNAIQNLQYEVLLGAALVALVIVLFLRRFRASVAVLIVLPLSLLIGALGFYFTGSTLNVMTLGGLALAVGTVVDAGIVVVENTVRHHHNLGKDVRQAAADGASEVAGPVLAGTITTLAVFTPVLFLSGMIRDLFAPLSLAAVITIGASYFLALTVIPTFCARFLGSKRDSAPEEESNVATGTAMERWYERMLLPTLRHPLLTTVFILAFTAASFLLWPRIGSELFPDVDAGTFEVRIKTIPGTRLEDTEARIAQIEDAIRDVIPADELQTLISNIGLPVGKAAGYSTILSSNSGGDTAFIVVNLVNEARDTSTSTYVDRLRVLLNERFPREEFLFVKGGIINAALNEGVAAPIDIQLTTNTLESGRDAAERIVRAVREVPGAVDVQIAQALDYPQLDVRVDRTKAAYYGLTQRDVAENVLTSLGSSTGYRPMIWVDPNTGTDFFVGVQFADNEADSFEELRNIPLAVSDGTSRRTIPLSSVAEIRRVNIPGEIARNNIARVVDVYANVSGRDLGSVVADVEQILDGIELPSGVTMELRGPVTTMRAGAESLGIGLLTAAILVFLVLMAQFRSLIDPLLIVLAIPLGLAGVVLMLYFTGTTQNIQSLTGTLMLIGVVVNRSILIVEFANARMREGVAALEAAVLAARTRLRPILMTALVLIASMLPFTFQLAPGNEAMVPLARALVGGLLVSTLLTLFLVPCAYVLAKTGGSSPVSMESQRAIA
jgi:CzcA family heavy metal efflux pump